MVSFSEKSLMSKMRWNGSVFCLWFLPLVSCRKKSLPVQSHRGIFLYFVLELFSFAFHICAFLPFNWLPLCWREHMRYWCCFMLIPRALQSHWHPKRDPRQNRELSNWRWNQNGLTDDCPRKLGECCSASWSCDMWSMGGWADATQGGCARKETKF